MKRTTAIYAPITNLRIWLRISKSATRIQEIEFARDSPLEEDRFELPVPPKTPGVRAVALSRSRRLSFGRKAIT
jgi:hypothetical protein